ncbi:hypothetical protein I6N95_17480 [Vagococcus sp. BWB3-3]|uniref:Uncharacterized protein n=1 Tax=Vagococcus allomyrinae TaxID=2794353 RepID=A0A940PAX8_9ENTE|nr:hypothetical protein [Vagococcus allomyrinae]MBP1042811.1 hypothetical protein [Vagococcus allomyrinae]
MHDPLISQSDHSLADRQEEQRQLMIRETKRLTHEIANLTEVSGQLVAVMAKLKDISTEANFGTTADWQPLKEQIDLGMMLGEILDRRMSIDEWIGRYLIGARDEARSIVKQALAVSEIIATPSFQNKHKKIAYDVTDSQINLPTKAPKPSTYLEQLKCVSYELESQCSELRQILEGKVR